jgi:TatD DNase family protein
LAGVHGWAFALGTHPQALTAEGPVEPLVPDTLDGAVAVGECGLDGGIPVPMTRQEAVLEAHLARARDAGLPLILHCRRAHHRLLPLLRRWAPIRGVLHSYSGGPELVVDYCRLGLHLSFAGAITRPGARKPVEALRRAPLHRLLLETDAPDQIPSDRAPARDGGEPAPLAARNEPARLVDIVSAAERIRGEALATAVSFNVRALGLWPPRPA